jgi:hypothetical protein
MAPQKKAKAETIYSDLGVAELIMSPVGLIVAAALRCGACHRGNVQSASQYLEAHAQPLCDPHLAASLPSTMC